MPLRFLKNDRSSKDVYEFNSDKSFEEGAFASVHEADFVISKNGKERSCKFVIKEFKEQGAAQHAFESYTRLKELGLKVPPTYRLDQDNNRILMTDYNLNGSAALSASSNNEHVKNLKIEHVNNLEYIKRELERQCFLAANEKIRLPIDAFFFLVNTAGGEVDMDFVIGDLDLIFSEYATELNLGRDECFKENMRNASEALQIILDRYGNKN